ncbi:hypothetical protein DYU11_25195 [Fibrisoma montanum]|uniref:Uncharacterized protein n=1 Tax=Fibrisoma montanum TaxID=2305895 RepID=A0A418M1E3_9BACT|nr:hypothetical protein [Fibrisoma montanum]RIV19400.1 hypothetical protein DYU11_25195 [Fibrisoma montanum]
MEASKVKIMDKQSLKAQLDQLHNLKVGIGRLTHGEASKAKWAMNNLTQKIAQTLAYFKALELPGELDEARTKAMDIILPATVVIQQEYANLKPNAKGFEVISDETDRQSELIRHALRDFDAKATEWLASH